VRVAGTTGVERGPWQLTGGVTLRGAEVLLQDVEFRRNRAEDALNLIRSQFALRDASFSDTASDAFDCDFCEGRLQGGAFRRIGGDGVDVSGSVVEVEDVDFEEIADKAISVGEASRLTARRVRVRNVRIGLAAKDGSDVVIEDSRISEASLAALMAYVKKSEYGPAAVVARALALSQVGRETVVQTGSRVQVDGVPRETEALDVDALYRDAERAAR
jgi:hypothetical protein